MAAVAAQARPDRALDLGTGGGHAAYRLAEHARRVTAVDLSPEMLAVVAVEAEKRGLPNIETCTARAECLPFEDGTFDMLACRFSAHHWGDWESGLREARRVLKPGGIAMFFDVVSSEYASCDTHLQAIELLRDPSHVRNRNESEWTSAMANAGFRLRKTEKRRITMDYISWVDRMRTPEAHRIAIRSLQKSAAAQIQTYFAIQADGSFSVDALQIEASACCAHGL
ncbi:ubiquinone/menaquinone biosynthesis C-methylase UbiE [Croceicoccus naphthovorans]|nr:ubiquinone/menaquinone biosynthesis C-methylase UbiE [Croceicoccus naphthovorans]